MEYFQPICLGPKRDNVSDGNGFTISYSIAAGSIVNNNIASMFNRPNAASTLKWNVSNLFLFSISGYKYILHIYAILLGALSVFRGLWSGVSQERSRQSNWILLLRSINDQGASLGRVTIIPLTLRNCGYISARSHIPVIHPSIHLSIYLDICVLKFNGLIMDTVSQYLCVERPSRPASLIT